MKTLLYSAVSVLMLSCTIPAWAAEPTLKDVQGTIVGTNHLFYLGMVVGATRAFFFDNAKCPITISGTMVKAVLDVHPEWGGHDFEVAVGLAMGELGCTFKWAYPALPAPTVSQ